MKVIALAAKYWGLKEDPNNTFKPDTLLGKLLHRAGQSDGEPWCCYLAEGLYCEAYPELAHIFNKLFSANCVKTLENFRKAGYPISAVPEPGALMIMRTYKDNKPLPTGHAGIVTEVHSKNSWTSIEGNTNEVGAREGTTVLYKKRKLASPPTGKRVEGFVLIPKFLKLV
jgi:hypothetical protein